MNAVLEKLSQPQGIAIVLFCSLAFIIGHFYATERRRKRRVKELLYGNPNNIKVRKRLWDWFNNFTAPLLPKSLNLVLTQNMLSRSGIKMSPQEFFAVRVAAGVIGGGLFSLLFIPEFFKVLLFGVAGGYMCYILPHTYVANRSIALKNAAARQCGNYVDLLKIAVAEGADITHAVELVSKNYPGVLASAFLNAINKTKGGKPIMEALKEMSDWLDTKDVTLLVDSIVQSRRTGTSLASVLEAQSIRMRDVIRTKATEQAQKAPVKMVFPLLFFILPSLMVIAMGPPMMKLNDIFNF
ncbi:type II secretion system F family protein [Desulfotruncus alcoholivorax]|uniref:type II secretion system F family protein n=1 Tax=Desulfotruncus alcoholivorax TaxID=265477 RepID=UPI00048385EB|nr:type II secretion system F family protein [Desulfotruncus alcoholivorax]